MSPKIIALIGTFDSKGEEFSFLRERIESAGLRTLMIDVGVLGSSPFEADVTRGDVAAAANQDLAAMQAERDRGRSVTAMALGATVILKRLFEQGPIHGVASLGGSAGTVIATAAMRALPYGFPKLMVSTLASGDTKPYVGMKDICMMPSVVDIAGLNRVSRRILSNAAGAICGMVACEPAAPFEAQPAIAATMFGVTTPCVTAARRILEARGYEVLVFHATGVGGQAMEQLIEDGIISSRSRHDDHRTRRRAGGRSAERRAASAGSSRPQGPSSAGLPGRDRHGEFRARGNSTGPLPEPQLLSSQPERHADADDTGRVCGDRAHDSY